MYTAAEALRMSTTGKIRHANWHPTDDDYLTFNEENKVWYQGEKPYGYTNSSLMSRQWIPSDPEKSELELAKEKYLNKWVKVASSNFGFKVIQVRFCESTGQIRIHKEAFTSYDISDIELLESSNAWGKGRCCVEDAPSEQGTYLIIDRTGSPKLDEWRSGWQEHYEEKGDLWWPLPEGEG